MRAAPAAAVAVAVAVALAACWTERPPRPSSTPVPGTLWVTPAQRWRTGEPPTRIAVDGATAMLGTGEGWIARFDLERGEVSRERRLPDITIDQLLALPGGRWLLVGRSDRRAIAATVDAATLEPTVVVTGERGGEDASTRDPNQAAVLDEGVAIAAEGLPLAIYDPATWLVRRVVDPAVGWTRAAGAGKALYAFRAGAVVRFDLATGASAKASRAEHHAATATYLLTRSYDNRGRWEFDVEAPDLMRRIAVGEETAALDPAQERIAVLDRATIHVHALADARRVASYELGDSGHGFGGAMAFSGGRLIVCTGAVVRVIDLATGAITPAGDPPYGGWGPLAVSADGEVLSLGARAVRIARGKIVASGPIGLDAIATGDPHQVARYGAIVKPADRQVEVREPGAHQPVRAWRTPKDTVRDMWLGRAGDVVISTDGLRAQRALLREAGAGLEELTPINFESWITDVDVDGGYALIGVWGTAHVVRLRDAAALHALPHPRCERYVQGRLERGGDRVILNHDDDVAVYRRSTGALVGAARIEEVDQNAIAFVPGRDEILIAARDTIVLWDPSTGGLRRLGGLAGIADVQVSADARRVAIAFHDGRVALAELDVLRAAMTPGRAAPLPAASARSECPSGDPFELDPDHQKDPDAGKVP